MSAGPIDLLTAHARVLTADCEVSVADAIEPVPGARCVFADCVQPNASSHLGVWLVVDG